jgi:two-component system sensor histidine kinase DegS
MALGMLLVLGMVFFRLSSLIGSIERQSAELAVLHDERGLVLDEITRAIEEERTRLAAELHDGPIQRVTGLGMRAYMSAQRLRTGDGGGAADQLEQIEDGLNREVRALRALMTQLRPPVLSERGLVDALRDHADSITAERGIATVVEGSIEGRPNEEAETGLYRIAQEALMNACRHSRAGRILVRVEPTGRGIRLTVRDDGVGFDAAARFGHDGGQHYGLLAMRERATMLHGSLTVTSAHGRGTTVVADVPLEDDPEDSLEVGVAPGASRAV